MRNGILQWLSRGFLAAALLSFVPITALAGSRAAASGKFEGRSNHIVTGGVTVLQTDSGHVVILEKDFVLDGAPDPKLGFGREGLKAYRKFSELTSHKGLQAYNVPESIDPRKFDLLWVWCE